MRYTIITPTVLRHSLLRTCESVDQQACTDWQHLVMVDCDITDNAILKHIAHPHRQIVQCLTAHHNGGNTCRHNAWDRALGEYLFYLDDDNWFTDDNILEDLKIVTTPWALFPILRHGQRFFCDPPSPCYVDTGNVIARREIGLWPDIEAYCSDGVWVDGLKQYPYQAFPDFRPIMVMPTSNFARTE